MPCPRHIQEQVSDTQTAVSVQDYRQKVMMFKAYCLLRQTQSDQVVNKASSPKAKATEFDLNAKAKALTSLQSDDCNTGCMCWQEILSFLPCWQNERVCKFQFCVL